LFSKYIILVLSTSGTFAKIKESIISFPEFTKGIINLSSKSISESFSIKQGFILFFIKSKI